jgi:hypothetical protein
VVVTVSSNDQAYTFTASRPERRGSRPGGEMSGQSFGRPIRAGFSAEGDGGSVTLSWSSVAPRRVGDLQRAENWASICDECDLVQPTVASMVPGIPIP